MKKFGFTLSEILIALGVIGVVAGLVLPQLLIGQKSAEARAQFDTAYSLLTKALADMEVDGAPIKPSSYNNVSLYNRTTYGTKEFKNYNRISVDCGGYDSDNNVVVKNDSVCISRSNANKAPDSDPYLTYSKNANTRMAYDKLDDGAFVLNNGMLFAFEKKTGHHNPWVSIDINGKNKGPNRWGWDLFTFELTDDGLLPYGADGTTITYTSNNNKAEYCQGANTSARLNACCDPNNTDSDMNGLTCAYFAYMDQDYFKKLYKGH